MGFCVCVKYLFFFFVLEGSFLLKLWKLGQDFVDERRDFLIIGFLWRDVFFDKKIEEIMIQLDLYVVN